MGANKNLALEQVEWDQHENPQDFTPIEFTEEIKPDLFGLEVEKANEMVSGLSVALAEREILKNAYVDVIDLDITTETLPVFKELRLKIVKNRTQGIEKWHKNNKAFYLAGGRFVDAVKNKEILVNEEMESKLLEAEKFFENQEKEKARLLNLQRIEKIKSFVEDAENMDFSAMTDEDFDDYVLGKKTRFENEQKEREAEALILENERLAEIERQKAIAEENLKLKLEAEAREKAIAEERKLQAEKESKLREEQAKKEAELKALADEKERQRQREIAEEKVKADALEAENKRKLKAEIEAREKAENEIRLKKESEEKAELLAKKEAEKLAKAPIKKQLNVWVESFVIPNTDVNNETSKLILEKFEAFKKWSKSEIDKL